MSDKTEEPTSKRLSDARKKGQVANSKEVVAATMLLGILGLLIALSSSMLGRFKVIIAMPVPFLDDEVTHAATTLLTGYLYAIAEMLAPVMLLGVVLAIGSHVGQFGLLLSGESAKPSLAKLNPAQWFKKTFGIENMLEFVKSIVKITVLGLVLFVLIRGSLQAMVRAPTCGLGCLQSLTGALLRQVVLWTAGPFIVVAAADYGFQQWNHRKKNRMTKDEVKREYKESEGDPHIKGKRKQLHQEMMAEGKVARAGKATVLITNPTHVAVAVYYNQDETPLPMITAVGTDLVAKRMMQAAADAGVPIMRDVPLARALLETGHVDQYIPSELVEPFAEVMRALQAMAG